MRTYQSAESAFLPESGHMMTDEAWSFIMKWRRPCGSRSRQGWNDIAIRMDTFSLDLRKGIRRHWLFFFFLPQSCWNRNIRVQVPKTPVPPSWWRLGINAVANENCWRLSGSSEPLLTSDWLIILMSDLYVCRQAPQNRNMAIFCWF